MQRFPNGAGGTSFFQKRVGDNAPDWLTTTIVSTPNGTTSRALVIADLAHFLWAVNLGCLGFHSWPVRTDDLEHPDELRIDLDPGPGHHLRHGPGGGRLRAGPARPSSACAGYIKTTGSRGLHVYVRLQRRWDSIAGPGRRGGRRP